MFITYHSFIKAQYDEACENSTMKSLLQQRGGFKSYKAKYIKTYGFSEYLLELRGQELNKTQVFNLATAFVKYGKWHPTNLPRVISALSTQYDLKLPVVYGILTVDYWKKRLGEQFA